MQLVRQHLVLWVLLLFSFAVMLPSGKDYGMGWDEPFQHEIGMMNYNYLLHADNDLLDFQDRNYGPAYELFLIGTEKALHVNDIRTITLMRHYITHALFLLSLVFFYFLCYRIFNTKRIALLGFLILLLSPRIYAHSYFNTKDIPFYALFIISLSMLHYAFAKRNIYWMIAPGVLCGLATSVRIMGVMLLVLSLLFILPEFLKTIKKKKERRLNLYKTMFFLISYGIVLYCCFPYLWRSPIQNFIESYRLMSHYTWDGAVLLYGKVYSSKQLPWFYFPIWFLISNPLLWLSIGFAGISLLLIKLLQGFKRLISNYNERFLLIALLAIVVPVTMVIILHAVIYDDWRHLYFVFPPFVLLALYFINTLKKYRKPMYILCGFQLVLTTFDMVRLHPFQEVYFNRAISHAPEYLRKHFEMDYWGVSMMDVLHYISLNDKRKTIKVAGDIFPQINPLSNNIKMMPPRDDNKFIISEPEEADYFITFFRGHPEDYPFANAFYEIKRENSTIIRVYKVK